MDQSCCLAVHSSTIPLDPSCLKCQARIARCPACAWTQLLQVFWGIHICQGDCVASGVASWLIHEVMDDELRGMLLQMQVFGHLEPDAEQADWKTPLENAFTDFSQWRKRHKLACSQKRFKYRTLHRDGYGFFLNAKGFNARIICEWLLCVILRVMQAPQDCVISDDRLDLCETALILSGNSIFLPF